MSAREAPTSYRTNTGGTIHSETSNPALLALLRENSTTKHERSQPPDPPTAPLPPSTAAGSPSQHPYTPGQTDEDSGKTVPEPSNGVNSAQKPDQPSGETDSTAASKSDVKPSSPETSKAARPSEDSLAVPKSQPVPAARSISQTIIREDYKSGESTANVSTTGSPISHFLLGETDSACSELARLVTPSRKSFILSAAISEADTNEERDSREADDEYGDDSDTPIASPNLTNEQGGAATDWPNSKRESGGRHPPTTSGLSAAATAAPAAGSTANIPSPANPVNLAGPAVPSPDLTNPSHQRFVTPYNSRRLKDKPAGRSSAVSFAIGEESRTRAALNVPKDQSWSANQAARLRAGVEQDLRAPASPEKAESDSSTPTPRNENSEPEPVDSLDFDIDSSVQPVQQPPHLVTEAAPKDNDDTRQSSAPIHQDRKGDIPTPKSRSRSNFQAEISEERQYLNQPTEQSDPTQGQSGPSSAAATAGRQETPQSLEVGSIPVSARRTPASILKKSKEPTPLPDPSIHRVYIDSPTFTREEEEEYRFVSSRVDNYDEDPPSSYATFRGLDEQVVSRMEHAESRANSRPVKQVRYQEDKDRYEDREEFLQYSRSTTQPRPKPKQYVLKSKTGSAEVSRIPEPVRSLSLPEGPAIDPAEEEELERETTYQHQLRGRVNSLQRKAEDTVIPRLPLNTESEEFHDSLDIPEDIELDSERLRSRPQDSLDLYEQQRLHQAMQNTSWENPPTPPPLPPHQRGNFPPQRQGYGSTLRQGYAGPQRGHAQGQQQGYADPQRQGYADPQRQGYVNPQQQLYADAQRQGYGGPQRQGYAEPQRQGYGNPQRQGYVDDQRQGYANPQQQSYGNSQRQGYVAPQRQSYDDPQQQGYADDWRQGYVDDQRQGYTNPQWQGYGDPQRQGYAEPQRQGYAEPQRQGYAEPQRQGYSDPQKQGYADPQRQGYTDAQRQAYVDAERQGYGEPQRQGYGDPERQNYSNSQGRGYVDLQRDGGYQNPPRQGHRDPQLVYQGDPQMLGYGDFQDQGFPEAQRNGYVDTNQQSGYHDVHSRNPQAASNNITPLVSRGQYAGDLSQRQYSSAYNQPQQPVRGEPGYSRNHPKQGGYYAQETEPPPQAARSNPPRQTFAQDMGPQGYQQGQGYMERNAPPQQQGYADASSQDGYYLSEPQGYSQDLAPMYRQDYEDVDFGHQSANPAQPIANIDGDDTDRYQLEDESQNSTARSSSILLPKPDHNYIANNKVSYGRPPKHTYRKLHDIKKEEEEKLNHVFVQPKVKGKSQKGSRNSSPSRYPAIAENPGESDAQGAEGLWAKRSASLAYAKNSKPKRKTGSNTHIMSRNNSRPPASDIPSVPNTAQPPPPPQPAHPPGNSQALSAQQPLQMSPTHSPPFRNQIALPSYTQQVTTEDGQRISVDVNLRLISPPVGADAMEAGARQPGGNQRQTGLQYPAEKLLPSAQHPDDIPNDADYAPARYSADDVLNSTGYHSDNTHDFSGSGYTTNPYKKIPPIPSSSEAPRSAPVQSEGSYMLSYLREREKTQKADRPWYRVYGMRDYKRMQKEVRLGTLGPDLDSDTYKERREKQQRQMEYAKIVKDKNSKDLTTKKPPAFPRDKTSSEDVLNKRKLAVEYARNVPKPTVKPKPNPYNNYELASKLSPIAKASTTPQQQASPQESSVEILDLEKLHERHQQDKQNAERIRQKAQVLS